MLAKGSELAFFCEDEVSNCLGGTVSDGQMNHLWWMPDQHTALKKIPIFCHDHEAFAESMIPDVEIVIAIHSQMHDMSRLGELLFDCGKNPS